VSRPALLQQVATIWNDEGLQKNRGSINSATIVRLFLISVFRRQAEKVRADRLLNFMKLNESELAFATRLTAVFMAQRSKQNRITSRELYTAMDFLWNEITENDELPARPELGEQSGPLKKRLSAAVDPVEVIATNVRSYGVLIRDFSSGDLFKFSHKSYFELLVAEYCAEIIIGKESLENRITSSTSGSSVRELLVSPVAASFCGELLSVDMKKEPLNKRFDRIYDFFFRRGLFDRCLPRKLHKTLFVMFPIRIALRSFRGRRRFANLRRYLLSSSPERSRAAEISLLTSMWFLMMGVFMVPLWMFTVTGHDGGMVRFFGFDVPFNRLPIPPDSAIGIAFGRLILLFPLLLMTFGLLMMVRRPAENDMLVVSSLLDAFGDEEAVHRYFGWGFKHLVWMQRRREREMSKFSGERERP
jgi:hypothetical protein